MFVTRRVTTRAEIDSSLLMYFSRRDSIYWGADIGAERPHPLIPAQAGTQTYLHCDCAQRMRLKSTVR
jgi:hypothetical protein